jgi:hypothetical protein
MKTSYLIPRLMKRIRKGSPVIPILSQIEPIIIYTQFLDLRNRRRYWKQKEETDDLKIWKLQIIKRT